MNLLTRRLRTPLLSLLSGVLALGLCLPASAQAAEKQRSAKKPVAAAQKAQRQAKKTAPRVAKKAPTRKSQATQASTRKRDTASAQRVARAKTSAERQRKAGARRTVSAKASSAKRTPVAKAPRSAQPVRAVATARQSIGQRQGLRASDDPLSLSSSVAYVMDQNTGEVLFSKNDSAVLPIASLTKLMTGLIIADAQLPMDEMITITQDDVDTYKGSRSRLSVGSTLTRGELMHLSLMSSENRAAHALGRTFPGGMANFVRLMNQKARDLGMLDTRFVEPTGLLSQNKSSARDLATLVAVAYERPILRDLSTSPSHQLDLGHRTLEYRNSNRLINNPSWDIGLQKTGYISEAGRCLVMQAKVAGRELIMVFLDASGKAARVQDAERIRHWVEAQGMVREARRPQG